MSIYGSRQLARYGHMGAAFGGGGPELFPGGPTFVGSDDQGVFYGTNTGFIQGAKNQGYTWQPASMSWQKQAAAKWLELGDPNASDADMAYKESISRTFATLLNSFAIAVGAHSMLGYSPDATQSIVSTGNQLKAALRGLITHQMQASSPSDYVTPVSTNSSSQALTAGSANHNSAGVPGDATSGSGASGESDNTMLYVGLGIGALALIGGVIALTRRSKSVAGYRRRRRR